MSKTLQTKKPRKERKPNVKKDITPLRKLVSRIEAREITGYSIDSLKRMEKRRKGPLDVVKLRGPNSNTFYKLDQINALIDAATNNTAPTEAG